jgi:hypothetical protein
MAEICRGGNRQIAKNFTEKELYSHSIDAPLCFNLSDTTINGLQTIRDWFNTPIIVTSTLRTPTGNALAGGVSNSRHLTGDAIDFDFQNNADVHLKEFYEQMRCKGELYRKLREQGINGMGIYDSFIHIDDRPKSVESFWDDSAGAWGDVRVNNKYMSQIPESGLSSSSCVNNTIQSEYGLKGILAPLDSSNYSGEDGIYSQSKNIKLLLIGGLLLTAGGVILVLSSIK